IWRGSDSLWEPVAALFDIRPHVVDAQAHESRSVSCSKGHRDDATHRRADQGEPRESQLVDEPGQIGDLIAVLVGAVGGPRALPMPAHVRGHDVKSFVELSGKSI